MLNSLILTRNSNLHLLVTNGVAIERTTELLLWWCSHVEPSLLGSPSMLQLLRHWIMEISFLTWILASWAWKYLLQYYSRLTGTARYQFNGWNIFRHYSLFNYLARISKIKNASVTTTAAACLRFAAPQSHKWMYPIHYLIADFCTAQQNAHRHSHCRYLTWLTKLLERHTVKETKFVSQPCIRFFCEN